MHKRNVENDIQIEATAHTPQPDVTFLLFGMTQAYDPGHLAELYIQLVALIIQQVLSTNADMCSDELNFVSLT